MKLVSTFALGFMISQQIPASAYASQAKSYTGSAQGRISYVTRLRSKFGSSIIYRSSKAAEIVKGFNIDCKQSDGRYIPLENVLLVGISQLQSNTSHVLDYVQEAGGEIRITQALMDSKGQPVTPPEVAFEINKWGELIPVGVPAGAVSVACAGAFGPIWVLPATDTEDDQKHLRTQAGTESAPPPQRGTNDQLGTTEPSSAPAKEWTHANKCEFFKLAAFSMINFRDQGRPQAYGLKMVALQLANYHTIADRGVSVEAGLEAETRLNVTADISRMAHDIWTVRNTVGEPIPTTLIIDFADHSCGWPAFNW